MSTSDPQHVSDSEEWNNCHPGEIQKVVDSLRKSRRNQQVKKAAVIGTSLVMLFAVSIFSFPGFSGSLDVEGQLLVCHEVMQAAEDYVAGRLSDVMHGRVDAHLSNCDHCRTFIDDLLKQNSVDDPTTAIHQKTELEDLKISFSSLETSSSNEFVVVR